MLAFDAAVPPSLDLGVDLLVEVRHRARAHPRAPQGFGNVLNPTHRNPRQIHLDQRLLNRALPPAVAFYDRRLKGLPAQLGNLEVHFTGDPLVPIPAITHSIAEQSNGNSEWSATRARFSQR